MLVSRSYNWLVVKVELEERSLHCELLGSPLYFILILIFVLCSQIPLPSQEALLYISNSIGPYLIIDIKQIKPNKYNIFYIHTKYNMQPHKFSHSFNKYLLRTFMKDTGTEIVRISKINTGNLQQSEKVEKNSERLKKTKKATQEIDLSQFNLRYLHVYKAKHLKLLTLTRLFINVVFVLRLMYNNYTHFWSWCDVFMHIHWATMTTSEHLFYLSH